jgi:SAM-dependent methyltransferase
VRDTEAAGSKVSKAFSVHDFDYDRWFDESEGRLIFESEVKAVRLLMKDLGPPFLEIGTGSGRLAVALGIHYGVEPAETLLKMAAEKGIMTERAYGERLPFPDGFFGGVFIIFTLCFTEEPAKVIYEAKRVLRTGGGLILGIINRESPWGGLYQTKKAEGHPIYRFAHLYATGEAAALLQSAGLTVKAYSSTLYRQPTDEPYSEPAKMGFSGEAGFVCMLATKGKEEIHNDK